MKFGDPKSSHMMAPGPGAYETKSEIGRLGFTMRAKTGIREMSGTNSRVGPGTYAVINQSFKKVKVKCIFGKSKRFSNKVRNQRVGPGAYNLPSMQNTIGYSMRPKTGISMNGKENPGPGRYYPKMSFVNKKFARTIFGKEKRGRENQNVNLMKKVGPSTYNPKMKRNAPCYSFGKDKKSIDRKVKTFGPGPGQYNIKSFLEVYPSYAMYKVN